MMKQNRMDERRSGLFTGILTLLVLGIVMFSLAGHQAYAGETVELPAEVPQDWWAQVQKNIAASEYHVTWQEQTVLPDMGPAYQAPNRAHNLRTYFTPNGFRMVPRTETTPSWVWGLELTGYGYEGAVAPAPAIQEIKPDKGRIEYDRGNLMEWYVNDQNGVEQGFTINKPPQIKETTGKHRYTHNINSKDTASVHPCSSVVKEVICLEMAVRGNLVPRMMADEKTIEFLNTGGVALMHYGQLKATDSQGNTLPVTMNLISLPLPASTHQLTNPPTHKLTNSPTHEPNHIRIRVDTTKAVYPVTIDPLIRGLPSFPDTWTAEGHQADARFAYSVATAGDVNGDGYSDVIVGVPWYDRGVVGNEGRVYGFYGSASGLPTALSWFTEGYGTRSHFGNSVATAGDVNGDGYSDVIVGEPLFDAGPYFDSGYVYVYYGSASGLPFTANWEAEGIGDDAFFGLSVASAGDVNGDGYSDIIVGAPGRDNDQTDEGRAYVFYGSASGMSGINWWAEGNQAYAFFGDSVASAGDVNGDGYSDVIVGAPYYDFGQTDEGLAFVFHGSASGLNIGASWWAESNQAEAGLGRSVCTAGDVNGDGYSDVIVGAPYYQNGQTMEGRAFVYYGSSTGLSWTAAWTAESNQDGAQFGYSVATAGDVNADGYSDVVVGARLYENGQYGEGGAFVYNGSASGLSATADWTAESNEANAEFGRSVATAGDVNGDGYSDVIVGAYRYYNGQTEVGRAYVFHGSAAGLGAGADWAAESNQANAYFGCSVATAGDVNSDGYSDVIVGAGHYDNGEAEEGRAFVYHGSATGLSTSADWTAESNQVWAGFGTSVATAGDVNGDGYSDVIVGAQWYDNGESNEGGAFVYHGSAAGLSASADWTGESDQADAWFGRSVATAGDVNGDGHSDVIVGAWWYDNGEADEGRAYVYHGSAAGLSAMANWTAESNQVWAVFGCSVATAGDVNGDGYSDVIVGTHNYDNGESNEGCAFVYQGSASGLSATAAWTGESNQADAGFGRSVATAGDVNGDGYSDIIVGADGYDNGESNEGGAFVYHGSAAGLSASADWIGESNQPSAYFGRSVATAGDVNGDGYSDVIVGADEYDNGEYNEGGAFVYYGSAAGLSTSADWTGESNQAQAYFGCSVATAGDVNGDGYSDVVVGAYGYDKGEADEGRAFVYYGSGACVPITVGRWTFDLPPEGWSYRTAVPPPDIPAWSHASSAEVTGPGAIGLAAPVDETTDHYGSWDNYSGDPNTPAIAWVDNSVWRAMFTMSTDKAEANSVPSIRLRLAENHMKATSYIQVLPGGWLPLEQRGIDTTDYAVYLRPPIADVGFLLAVDMIDFGQPFAVPCDGTVYLEEVVVERFDLTDPCLDSYWTDVITYSGTGLHSWTHSSAGVPYLTDVTGYSQPADGLEQNTTMAQTRVFGAWTCPADEVDLVTDQFYRAIWTLACEDSSLGGAERLRLHTQDFRYSSYILVDRDINPANSALPPSSGKDYYLYAEFPGSPTVDKLLLAWDLFEFDPNAGGWAKLTDVIVSRRDSPQ